MMTTKAKKTTAAAKKAAKPALAEPETPEVAAVAEPQSEVAEAPKAETAEPEKPTRRSAAKRIRELLATDLDLSWEDVQARLKEEEYTAGEDQIWQVWDAGRKFIEALRAAGKLK